MPRVARFALVVVVVPSLTSAALSASVGSSRRAEVDVSRAAGPQNEASIAVDPTNPKVLVAASQNFPACAIRVYGSTDGGSSWTSDLLQLPDAARIEAVIGQRFCAGNEWVAIDGRGQQYVALIARDPTDPATNGLFIASRARAADAWTTPVRLDPSLRDVGYDDKPMLAVDTSASGPYRGRLYVAWTRHASVPNLLSPVLIAHSDDQGLTWSKPSQLGKIGGWGVHLAPASDGTVYAAWWGGAGLVIVRSTDGGARFTSERQFASLVRYFLFGGGMIPAEPTEPVQPRPSLGVDRSNGRFGRRVYAAYSKPTNSGRRIFVTAFDLDLKPLFTRVLAPAERRGTFDEFNPSIAVDSTTGIVWSCFYLTGTGSERKLATFSCATSRDGGARWTAPFGAASVPSNETQRVAFNHGVSSEYASYEGLAVADGVAHPIWTDTRQLKSLGEEIYTTRLTPPRVS